MCHSVMSDALRLGLSRNQLHQAHDSVGRSSIGSCLICRTLVAGLPYTNETALNTWRVKHPNTFAQVPLVAKHLNASVGEPMLASVDQKSDTACHCFVTQSSWSRGLQTAET